MDLVVTPFQKQLKGYRLTIAHIFYHMPDHPAFLQEFIWQDLDLAPDFPTLRRFLAFWNRTLDGKLHSVRICSRELISDFEIAHLGHEFNLN